MLNTNNKYKAQWIDTKKASIQFLISIKSYIQYPFSKKTVGATKKFFSKIYDGSVKDDFIFDGNDNLYLMKVKDFFEINTTKCIKYDFIYDCGCGNCSFLRFLIDNGIFYGRYIGIDFAQKERKLSDKVQLIQSDIAKYDSFDNSNKKKLIVLCNVLCYLPRNKIESLLKRIQSENTQILVIDPIPSIFWDATFEHVKLYYRSAKKVDHIMVQNGFYRKKLSKDYLFKIRDIFLFPLSYGALYDYSKDGDKIKLNFVDNHS